MNRRILVVEQEGPEAVAETLGRWFDVTRVASGAAALQLCHRKGPFAVALCAHELADMDGVELLERLRKGWPDTVRVLTTGLATLDVALYALHRGAIFRFVRLPAEPRTLREALDDSLERHRQLAAERLLTEQLQFSRESLLGLTEAMERRMAVQLARLQGLQQFSSRLNRARSLEQVARLTAVSTSRLLGDRGVRVVLEYPDERGGVDAIAGMGPEPEPHVHPVLTADGVIGRIELDHRAPNGFGLRERDHELLASLAASAAIAATNQIHRRERDDAQHATIFALARLAEFRDNETGRHLDRVSEYCRLIAVGMREDGFGGSEITDGFVQDLVLSAPLHDIGKVGVPDSILLKAAPLSEDEWEVMRRHPSIGAETLSNALETSGEQTFLRMGHDIAWCHHERWDGSGYPRGLAGEEIPLSARIMSLADCYDALTTERPYKSAWPHAQALEYVREQAGRHFDPEAVASFLERERQVDRVRRRMADHPGEESASAPAA